MIATLDANQFQTVVLAFIAALVVIIPSASAVIIKAITSWQDILAAWHRETAAKVAQHEVALNGGMDKRIDDRARAIVEQSNASGDAGLPAAGANPVDGRSVQGQATSGGSGIVGK